jgi:TM2 domain-containing membrane protein YozV
MKSTAVAYLLWFIFGFGILGIHRFYTGNVVSGIIWFFTGGLFGIGAIIDLFLIPGLVRDANAGK